MITQKDSDIMTSLWDHSKFIAYNVAAIESMNILAEVFNDNKLVDTQLPASYISILIREQCHPKLVNLDETTRARITMFQATSLFESDYHDSNHCKLPTTQSPEWKKKVDTKAQSMSTEMKMKVKSLFVCFVCLWIFFGLCMYKLKWLCFF